MIEQITLGRFVWGNTYIYFQKRRINIPSLKKYKDIMQILTVAIIIPAMFNRTFGFVSARYLKSTPFQNATIYRLAWSMFPPSILKSQMSFVWCNILNVVTSEDCTKLLLTNTSYNQPLPGLLDISRSELDVRVIMVLLNLENNKLIFVKD